jgi:hypothetical protein
VTDPALLARLGVPAPAIESYEVWGTELAPVLDRLDEARARHLGRGLPEALFWATMDDVGVLVARHHREHGRWGVADRWWLDLHLRGDLLKLGALQFERKPGGALGVHVQEGARLDPAACDEAFALARDRFAGEGFDRFTCSSWLLDDQLAAHLPADSNIVRFQRRFSSTGKERPGDADVLKFVFGRVDGSWDRLPRTTTLERALQDHVAAGGHWRTVEGAFAF